MMRRPEGGIVRVRASGIIRIPAVAFALVLFWLPLRVAPIAPVAVMGGMALLLAVAGIVMLRRGLATAAGCVFLADFAGALWMTAAPVGVGVAAGFGLCLLFLLQTVDLGRRARGATVGPRVAPSLILRAAGIAAATLAASLLVTTLAGAAAAAIPFVAAPFVAAAGAFGVVLAVAVATTGAARRESARQPRAPST